MGKDATGGTRKILRLLPTQDCLPNNSASKMNEHNVNLKKEQLSNNFKAAKTQDDLATP